VLPYRDVRKQTSVFYAFVALLIGAVYFAQIALVALADTDGLPAYLEGAPA